MSLGKNQNDKQPPKVGESRVCDRELQAWLDQCPVELTQSQLNVLLKLIESGEQDLWPST